MSISLSVVRAPIRVERFALSLSGSVADANRVASRSNRLTKT